MVIATWCQREETPEAPLTPKEKADLQFLYDEWAHPYFVSVQEYGRLLEVTNVPSIHPASPSQVACLYYPKGDRMRESCVLCNRRCRCLEMMLLGRSYNLCKCTSAALLAWGLRAVTSCIAVMAASDNLRHAEQYSACTAGHWNAGIGGNRRLDAPNAAHMAPLQLGRRLGPLACHPQVQPLCLVQGAAACTPQ